MKRRRRGDDGEGGGRLLNPSAGWRDEGNKREKEGSGDKWCEKRRNESGMEKRKKVKREGGKEGRKNGGKEKIKEEKEEKKKGERMEGRKETTSHNLFLWKPQQYTSTAFTTRVHRT